MKDIIFRSFKKISRLVSGKGLGKLPFAPAFFRFAYKSLKPKGIIEIPVLNFRMKVDSKDTGVGPYLIMKGQFAPSETAVLKNLLKPEMTFVDVGANIGYFTLLAAPLVKRVVAFEPEEKNFELLKQNVHLNALNNVVLVKKAVSDRIEKRRLYLDNDNPARHSLSKHAGEKSVSVDTTTLDSYFQDEKVNVVKIDVEGAEPAVFKGMRGIVKRNDDLKMIVEFYPKAIAQFGFHPERFLKDLVQSGFTLFQIVEGGMTREIKDFAALSRGEGFRKLVNILCVKNKISS